jgi:NCS1 family nucleobase:cation symporter-1
MIGWSGLILVMFGNGIRNIAETFGYEPGDWIVGTGVALGLWLSYIITTRGVHLLSAFNAIITPGLGLLVAFMFYMLLSTHGWDAIAMAQPLEPMDNPLLNYAIVVELGIASGISWWGGIGFLARNTRTRRNSIYPEILQLGFSTGVVCSVALFSGLIVQTDDPTEWMVPIGGPFMGVLALLFIALANVTSTSVSLYASGLALRHVPALRGRPWWQLIVVTILPCVPFVFWPHKLYDLGDAFLAYNGTMYAPISGIVFADYIFLRGQRLNLRAIFESAPSGEYYYWKGLNMLALASLVLGQAVYLSLYNPLTAEAHWLFHFVPASIAACLIPAVVYGAGTKLLGIQERAAAKAHAPGQPSRLVSPNI